jgi:hypothetical protein
MSLGLNGFFDSGNVRPPCDGEGAWVNFSPGLPGRITRGHIVASTQPKSERVNLRATKYQVELLRRASTLAGLTLSTYILSTAVTRAELEIQAVTTTNTEES